MVGFRIADSSGLYAILSWVGRNLLFPSLYSNLRLCDDIRRANCVGKDLALREMRMFIAAILLKFEVRAVEGYDYGAWEEQLFDALV